MIASARWIATIDVPCHPLFPQFRREVVPATLPFYEHLPSLKESADAVTTLHRKATALASLYQLVLHPALTRLRDHALTAFSVRSSVEELEAAQKKAQLLKEIRTHLKVHASVLELLWLRECP